MAYETILTEVEDQILTVTLNRPDKLNAFNGTMMNELIEALDRADRDDDVRAVVVTGAGRAFCAGADLSAGASTFDRGARAAGPAVPVKPDGEPDLGHDAARDGGGRVALRIFDLSKPVIAACNGPAVGIGATMQLPMDVRIASQEARYGFVFSRRGIVPEACSTWFLPRLVGISQALDWGYSGRVFPAAEALEAGLVARVVPPGELLVTARAVARSFIDGTAPVSVALIRHMMWKMLGAEHPMEAHKIESRGIFVRGKSGDVQEGVASFLEKRPPNFSGTVSKDMPAYFPWWPEPKYD